MNSVIISFNRKNATGLKLLAFLLHHDNHMYFWLKFKFYVNKIQVMVNNRLAQIVCF